jgi:DNA-binding MarR family transcriptional regulator
MPDLPRAKSRATLMKELREVMRRSSAQGALFGQAVANAIGLSTVELECMGLLHVERRVTAGRLAEITGLTTGAITGLVDRLEKAGFVRRERDDTDRRKVRISVVPEAAVRVEEFYVPLQRALNQVWDGYSEAELQLLLRFANDEYKAVLEATEALNERRTCFR